MEKKKILIVDDEVAFTRTLKLNLERTGLYEVRTENKGRFAAAAAKEFKPDLILLDVHMPDYDGGTVASRLKSDSALKDIPIIFLTATVSTRESGAKGTQRGGFFFLAKPVAIEQLIECIEQHTAPPQKGTSSLPPPAS
ncbi:MAG: response regulator [Limisphaerales bacterium]